MIHHDILHTIKQDKLDVSFIYPYYGKYSIAEIPPTILAHFNVPTDRPTLPQEWVNKRYAQYKKLLFFFIDGFGFDHFTDYYREQPFFQRLAHRGEVYPLTSVFPSTTPAALTTIHTNKTPQEHGLPEWTVYFEEFDRIIETFPFRPIQSPDREILLTMGGAPEMLYSGSTLYQTLKEHSITPYVFTYKEYAKSAYSTMTQRGSTIIAYTSFDDLFKKLRTCLITERNPSYFFVYWSHVDSTEHVFGPRSKEHIQALFHLSIYLEQELAKLPNEVQDEILFLMSSDHGQSSINGEDIIYLNAYLPLEENYLRSLNSQHPIQPTGSPHDVFLHIYPPKIPATIELLQTELQGKAEAITIQDAIQRGLFGIHQPIERFLKRVGDILILPYEGYHIWYKHAPSMHFGQKGMHGGLSQEEMIVPFIVAQLKDIL